MKGHLAVGVQTSCFAPLALERLNLRLATLLGAQSLLVPDHYVGFVPRSLWRPELTPAARIVPTTDAFFDPFVMMGMMAARYRRVRIGTGVTEPFRRHPATLAQAFVTLDHMTRGRAILGIGNGERENVEPYGLTFTKRVGRLKEALRVIRLLWESRGEPVDFDGSVWRLRRARFATPLYGGNAPAIWVAAHAPRMLALAGRFGDGWYPTKKIPATEYGEKLGAIRAAAAEAGRPFDRFEPALQMHIALGHDRPAVLAELMRVPAAAAMSMLLPGALWKRHGLAHPLGDAFEGFPDFVPEEITPEHVDLARRQLTPELIADGIFAGSLDEVVGEVKPYVDAGLRHLVVWNIGLIASGGSAGDLVRFAASDARSRARGRRWRRSEPARSILAPPARSAPLGIPLRVFLVVVSPRSARLRPGLPLVGIGTHNVRSDPCAAWRSSLGSVRGFLLNL